VKGDKGKLKGNNEATLAEGRHGSRQGRPWNKVRKAKSDWGKKSLTPRSKRQWATEKNGPLK